MSTKYTIIASMFAVLSGAAFSFKVNHYGVFLSALSVLFFLVALLVHREEIKKIKNKNVPGGIQIEAFSTDPETKLVIKSIGQSENGHISFTDIESDTNLWHPSYPS